MSRGGRGGGRGGRGGARGGGRPQVPWDTGDEPDARPSELFPPYAVPEARPLTKSELASVRNFLLLRHQIHSSPLYTSKRTSALDPTAPRKIYGQAQMNATYGVKSKASVDPFTAMPTYSQKFVREERALPDWSSRPICRELFPAELLDTVGGSEGLGDGAPRKKRRLELSSIRALPSAEEAFGIVTAGDEDGAEETTGTRSREALERLERMRDDEPEDAAPDDDEGAQEEEEDEAYDDEDAGDYDAENYFETGSDFGDDYGDADDGEGTF
ncbi:hypothetical protein S7711_01929 [Stachybotrys chartarum IBT 7711]|uniref:DNA-directed RNA polymerase III subunit n=1 Tax=Stachybotrys chartarum (strain CBS 109288 / IBT 7711) TaxID=1280523 RepID=A0A084AMV5_STACB|nr:hypothetical protein S7711_01929 [Stachybotrys chartarum IBT 7711]KFA48776.1 hypothetical protein S40293_01550 [Stachybotrys chartarum IBT 40293]KFA75607.1 hypothetical protein S40288_04477 [Stachybotrys chartarum IBT 40288]